MSEASTMEKKKLTIGQIRKAVRVIETLAAMGNALVAGFVKPKVKRRRKSGIRRKRGEANAENPSSSDGSAVARGMRS